MVEHWDLYRLKTLPVELLEPPAEGVLRIVEWPERIEGFVASLELVVSLRVVNGEARVVVLSGIKAAALGELLGDFNSKECSQSA
jgi:tRNA A37 threonylcarbamoyladenosine biosynthesis protein TsaE